MYGPDQPTVQFLPPTVISQYVNQWITTSIPNYGEVTAYVTDFNRRTGMVSMFIYRAPSYQPQFIQVHNSDLVGIAPYYGPVPPRPGRPPRPRPPYQPGGGYPGGGYPGGGYPGGGYPGGGYPGGGYPGGGFIPWIIGQAFGSSQQRY